MIEVLRALTALSLHRPQAETDHETWAAWYDAKALLHYSVANEGGPDADKARRLAEEATHRAASLRAHNEQ
jgi:hypothetical protein